MRSLFGVASVRVEAPRLLQQALDWVEDGFEFADALHLASAKDCDALITFDKDFVKLARGRNGPVVRLP